MIPCDEITNTINELLSKFSECKVPSSADLTKVVELIAAVNSCQNGGDPYNTKISIQYDTHQDVIIPAGTFHAFSLNVLSGSIIYEGFNFPAGSSRNVEYTTLNATPLIFRVNAGSQVLLEYLIETV